MGSCLSQPKAKKDAKEDKKSTPSADVIESNGPEAGEIVINDNLDDNLEVDLNEPDDGAGEDPGEEDDTGAGDGAEGEGGASEGGAGEDGADENSPVQDGADADGAGEDDPGEAGEGGAEDADVIASEENTVQAEEDIGGGDSVEVETSEGIDTGGGPGGNDFGGGADISGDSLDVGASSSAVGDTFSGGDTGGASYGDF